MAKNGSLNEGPAEVKRDSGSRSEAPASRVSRTRVFVGGDPVRRGSRAEAGARSGEQRAGTVRARRLRESLLLPRAREEPALGLLWWQAGSPAELGAAV
ncbi:hypothetical protein NDU88_003196 [Pleurodeles waltl]|uniref:Uncharacterized protein n=1 Tax=Pleurodeles waltl TaxID=8319 RepID=A0AAV7M5I4_PLEWA|nr:hypothetical protein NDU88_003196 [Pleurodeles waltl]